MDYYYYCYFSKSHCYCSCMVWAAAAITGGNNCGTLLLEAMR